MGRHFLRGEPLISHVSLKLSLTAQSLVGGRTLSMRHPASLVSEAPVLAQTRALIQ